MSRQKRTKVTAKTAVKKLATSVAVLKFIFLGEIFPQNECL